MAWPLVSFRMYLISVSRHPRNVSNGKKIFNNFGPYSVSRVKERHSLSSIDEEKQIKVSDLFPVV